MATALDKYADMKPSWDEPVMIESHQNGVRTKEMNPNTPITDDELVEDAIRCWDAGPLRSTTTIPISTCRARNPSTTT